MGIVAPNVADKSALASLLQPAVPDLLPSAVAASQSVTLLHYDADFDLIAAVTREPMRWVVVRGSVP